LSQPESKTEIMTAKQAEEKITRQDTMRMDLAQVKRDYDDFVKFKNEIIMSNNAFHVVIKGKDCINKAGWRAVAMAFHLSDEIIEKNKIDDPDGKNYTIEVIGRVFHKPSGRSVVAVGSCSTQEIASKKLPLTYHNVLATAHTKMKNRGISDIVGSGELSVEELEEEEHHGMSDAEQKAREAAKNFDKRVVCPDCSERFMTFEMMATHRKEAHAQ